MIVPWAVVYNIIKHISEVSHFSPTWKDKSLILQEEHKVFNVYIFLFKLLENLYEQYTKVLFYMDSFSGFSFNNTKHFSRSSTPTITRFSGGFVGVVMMFDASG